MSQEKEKFFPCIFTTEQKQWTLIISLELCDHTTSDSSFLRTVITWDGIWACDYDETKVKSSQWQCSVQNHQARSNIQMVWIVFFDLDAIAHAKLVPWNKTWTLNTIGVYYSAGEIMCIEKKS